MQIPKNLSLETEKDGIEPYIVDGSLQRAVEYAYLLKRPLLLRGEPGCGKTRFAKVLAYQVYTNYNLNKADNEKINFKDKYFEWNIKSTSKAKEGLYIFDHLKRLQDSQIEGKLKEDKDYIKLGKLGEAFEASKKGIPSIVLIDEIDKAEIDFPNDLLLELDQMRFVIEEIKEEKERNIIAEEPPLVIITSNDERELPNAFLRRCVFCYINFPEGDNLVNIVKSHIKCYVDDKKPLDDEKIKAIITEFDNIHKSMKNNGNKDKVVSTSELLDWVKVIYEHYKAKPEDGIQLTKKEIIDGKEKVVFNYSEVLFKTLNDFNLFHAKQD